MGNLIYQWFILSFDHFSLLIHNTEELFFVALFLHQHFLNSSRKWVLITHFLLSFTAFLIALLHRFFMYFLDPIFVAQVPTIIGAHQFNVTGPKNCLFSIVIA